MMTAPASEGRWERGVCQDDGYEAGYLRGIRQEYKSGTSLVAQWLGIHPQLQGMRVQALVWEDPTCRGATKPVRHSY